MTPHAYELFPGWERPEPRGRSVIGVLCGEGIGREVVGATLDVLAVAADGSDVSFDVREGGAIGREAIARTGKALTPEVADFCRAVFRDGGAVLCGPGGGRFVYELRAALGLYCKLTPIRPIAALDDAAVVKPEARRDVDVLHVRELSSGVYAGHWTTSGAGAHRSALHTFGYTAGAVERILRVACAAARGRRGRLAVVVKPDGVPAVSRLWSDVLDELRPGAAHGLDISVLEVDNAAFQLVQGAAQFDVVVAPNLCGDVLADVTGVMLGSRGLCHSGNFGADGAAVYNTGHGAAYDLADRDCANPLGTLLTLTMLLRASFGLEALAGRIERAIDQTVAAGWRTPDMTAPGCTVVGTRELGRRVAEALLAGPR